MKKTIYSREQEVLLFELQKVRRAAGLTQKQLAEKIGESQSWVSECETGERRIDALELRAYCRAIGASFPDFIRQVDEALERENL